MMVKAYSGSGGVSSEKIVLTKIKYSTAQAAVVKPLSCPTPEVKAPAAKPAAKASTKPVAPKAAAKTATQTTVDLKSTTAAAPMPVAKN
jgi:hypothetical protein